MATQKDHDVLIDYYHRELRYLRQAGTEFARQHPQIARRLDLHQVGESPDPHIERLLESFAFLTARLSKEIDDRIPQIAAAILDTLYPQLTVPQPSVSLAQFQLDPEKAQLTSGYLIPAKTSLMTYAEEGVSCRFMTTYPVTLWPIRLIAAHIVSAGDYEFVGQSSQAGHYLKLTLQAPTVSFQELDLQALTFFIQGDRQISFRLYEALFAQTRAQIFLSTDGKNLRALPLAQLNEVGFHSDETLFPTARSTHPAYQVVQDYFHFPEKFLFFQLSHLNFGDTGEIVELFVSLDQRHLPHKLEVSADNFLLGCTPIVNLFHKITDPFRLTHRTTEYRLVPDQRRERTHEIYSITQVLGIRDGDTTERSYVPYFSLDHKAYAEGIQAFWLARRTTSHRPDLPGSEVYLSFVDEGFNPTIPPDETIFAHTLCTNRFLATQIPLGGRLEIEETSPAMQIVNLRQPVPPSYSPHDGETLWQLVAQLSVNYLSLQDVKALRESLRLLARDQGDAHVDLDRLHTLRTQSTVCRIGDQAWRGFVKGVHVTLEVSEQMQSGTSTFLLGRVLQQYLALQVSINSFVELELFNTQHQEVWKQWPAQSGMQTLL